MHFRFLHASDLHLDTPFETVSGVPSTLLPRLRDASLAVLDRLVETAIAERVEFVLLAGDIYDGVERGVRARVRLRSAFDRLSRAGIEALLVHGNHDPVAGGGYGNLPERVTLFSSAQVESHEIVRGDNTLAVVHGISFPQRETKENLARRFRRRGDGFEIGLLHASVEGAAAEHAPYAPCSAQDLRQIGLDYWALGHVHLRQTILRGGPWALYPGITQGRSFKPSECGAKGALIVDVLDGRVGGEPRFVPLDAVRFERLTVDISGLPDPEAVHAALMAQALPLRHAAEGRILLLRARLIGAGATHGALSGPAALEALRLSLNEAAALPDVVWCSVESATRPALDLQALARGEDLSAHLIREAEQVAADPDRLQAWWGQLAQELPHEARPPFDPTVARESLQQSLLAALAQLDAAEGSG